MVTVWQIAVCMTLGSYPEWSAAGESGMKKNKMEHTGISVYKRNGKKTAKREWQSVAQAAYDSRMWRFVWRLRSRNLCQCVSGYGG